MNKALVAASAVVFCVALATAQAPQPPPVTPMKFAYYPATDLKALANTLKGGGQIKFNRLHRGDHDFQGMSFRAKSAGGARDAQQLGRPLLHPRRRSAASHRAARSRAEPSAIRAPVSLAAASSSAPRSCASAPATSRLPPQAFPIGGKSNPARR